MMHEAFLEQLYRWLEPLVDWLLTSSRMEWLAGIVEGFHMADALMLAAMLVLGLALGGLFVIACYATELGRQARFLTARDRASNARLTCGSRLPGMVGMVDAVNAEIDVADAERVEALRAADEFSRGLSALSHDVRTPLTGARGYLQLAREEEDPARRDAQLAAADARLSAMSGLLDELFSYARAADPDIPLELGPIALRPLLEQVLVGHYPEFEERGWEPTLACDEVLVEALGIHGEVPGDRVHGDAHILFVAHDGLPGIDPDVEDLHGLPYVELGLVPHDLVLDVAIVRLDVIEPRLVETFWAAEPLGGVLPVPLG